jgi:hypothetical protein
MWVRTPTSRKASPLRATCPWAQLSAFDETSLFTSSTTRTTPCAAVCGLAALIANSISSHRTSLASSGSLHHFAQLGPPPQIRDSSCRDSVTRDDLCSRIRSVVPLVQSSWGRPPSTAKQPYNKSLSYATLPKAECSSSRRQSTGRSKGSLASSAERIWS